MKNEKMNEIETKNETNKKHETNEILKRDYEPTFENGFWNWLVSDFWVLLGYIVVFGVMFGGPIVVMVFSAIYHWWILFGITLTIYVFVVLRFVIFPPDDDSRLGEPAEFGYNSRPP